MEGGENGDLVVSPEVVAEALDPHIRSMVDEVRAGGWHDVHGEGSPRRKLSC